MNILFYTTNEVAPQYGGVERVTANIANALTTFYNVYNPQIEMFARFKMKSSFHKTKRII